MNKLHIAAHRGLSVKYPENSISAMQAAVDIGCQFLELDIQLSKDRVPIVIHDKNLERITGHNVDIFDLTLKELNKFSASEPGRLGNKFAYEPIPTLYNFIDFLQKYPNVHVFIEFKTDSADKFGIETFVNIVMPALEPVKTRCTLISFSAEILEYIKSISDYPIGWVLYQFNEQWKSRAENLAPHYLICNYTKINNKLWKGPWQWFIYEVTDSNTALSWFNKGVTFIESMEADKLLNDPQIKKLTNV